MPNDEASQVIQGDSECRDGHYRPKKDLRNQSEEAKLHAAALDSVEDALSQESQNPVEPLLRRVEHGAIKHLNIAFLGNVRSRVAQDALYHLVGSSHGV